ncbi:MAG TPA: 3'(2'),5'-bisphosphate nucleotidase CysQ [Alphaproteobacteria bacterium]|nr:3'(2'),5'-bisphosphate nucleotidase CysQ [Alphaproteobacteria bacterium]HNS45219.1 3'(2'),5'-bisphosphate nucleotidase CysQ [Alphaproteobacteria bacterium]
MGFPLEDWLERCIEIADRAGDAIMEVYARPEIEKVVKDDKSPLTEADLAANRIIVDALKTLTPDIVIVSEEEAEKCEGHKTFWLVDPLDGTREFLKRNGEFTVNIALVHNGLPVLGVVSAPALGGVYAGGQGLPARKRENGEWSKIETDKNSPSTVRIVASRSHGSNEVDLWIEKNFTAVELLSVGSSLKFCMVAEGKAHYYPRFGRTMEWDTAAGQAVLMAAGGSVITLDNQPFIYGKKGFENPHLIAKHNL